MPDFNKHISDFLLKSGFIGFVIIDREANMIYTNDVFDNLMRGIEGSVQGMNLIEVLREEEKEGVRQLVENLFKHGKIPKSEWDIINRLDEQLYLDFEGQLIEEDGEQFGLGLVIDRTNEFTLKKNLQYTNDQRELAIKTGKLGIWKLNLASNTNIWNDELLDIYELTREEWEADLEGWQNMLFPEDAEIANQELAKAFAGEYVFDVRFRIKTKTGKVKHVYASAGPFFNEQGDVVEVHGVNIDVTSLVETEQKASLREHYFKNITEKLPGLVVQYYINPDGTDGINYLSKGVEELYGLDHEETSKDVSLIWKQVVPEDVPAVAASLQESAANMTDWEATFRIHDTKGTLKYVRTVGSPEKDENGRITWDTIALDVTEEVTLNNAIKEKQLQLKNITDKFPGVVLQYFIDKEGNDGLNYLSDGVKKVYGLDQEEAFANVNLIWERALPEYLPGMAESIQKSAETMEDWDHIWEAKDIDGNHKFLRGIGTPHKTDDGKIVWDTITLDITKQIRQEKEIQDQRTQLLNFTDQLPGVALRYFMKPDGTDGLLFLSKGVEDIYEVDRDSARNDNSILWNQVHPDDIEGMQSSIMESAKNLSRWEHVNRIVTPSGKTKYLSSVGIPSKTDDGTVIWDTISMDITAQVRHLEELNDKQAMLDNLTNQVPGMVYIYQLHPDGTDRFVYQSKGVEEIFEIEQQVALADTSRIWACIHPEDIPEMTASVQKSAKELSRWEALYRIITPSGKLKYIQGSGSPVKLEDGTTQWYSLGIDITKEIEQKNILDEQRQQIENLTNSIQGVVLKYQVHPDGSDSIPYISNRVKEYWGVDPETATSDTSKAWARVVPEDIELTAVKVQESIENMSPWTQIMRFTSSNGEVKHMQGYGLPTLLEDGTVEYDTVMIDVTDQEIAKQEAEEKQRELDIIGDQIPGVVFTYYRKPDGTDGFSHFSDGFEELHGFDRAKALENSKLLWDQTHPDDISDFVDALMKSATNMEKFDYQYRIIRPDGEVRFLQGFGSPTLKEDGTVVWNAFNLDITQRMHAEIEANRSNTKLRSFIETSPIAIYQIDPEGKVTDFWNPAAEQVYGWTKEEVINKTMPSITEGSLDEFQEIIEDIRISHKPKQFQVTRENRYKEKIILEITAGPLFDEQGKLTDLLIIANDITELTEYRKTLESALREKEILLQEIHHRVKNNLAIISGLLELQALKDDNEHDMSLIIEARNRIHSIAMVHEQLYQDMDFSHINPGEYYKKLLKKLQANTTSAERDVNYDLKFDIDKININRAVPLGLLINELFTNSIKHAFSDGKGNLKLHFTQQGDQIRVLYEDDGPGFVIDDIKDKNTIGWQLIETLLLQLDSTYSMDTEGRFMLDFTFKESFQGSQAHFN